MILIPGGIDARLLVPPSMVSLVPGGAPRRTTSAAAVPGSAAAADVDPSARGSLDDVDEPVQNDVLDLELHAVDARLEGPL